MLFEFEAKESLVSGTNALLVGALMSLGDDGVIKAIVYCFLLLTKLKRILRPEISLRHIHEYISQKTYIKMLNTNAITTRWRHLGR